MTSTKKKATNATVALVAIEMIIALVSLQQAQVEDSTSEPISLPMSTPILQEM